tara:strand:+ start:27729 stop:30203 length:2475 start_codon:yes stop_codon:yes gene_type:complete
MGKIIARTTFVLLFSFLNANNDPPYQRTRDREIDVHHTKINIGVSLISKNISGNVVHTISPLKSSLSHIKLDSKDLIIRRIRVDGMDIEFFQEDNFVNLKLNKSISWEDTINVKIDYTAQPRKGLYFVTPDATYPDKKWQAWTQGEDMDNSHWVPIYDYPNDRATFECILTVDKKYSAISNGELVSKVDNPDGTHTWHWRENFPMVSYLISFVVGEYVKIEDSFEGMPINYWVYEENMEQALRSFGKTSDMIEYLNKMTGIEYPYEKYDQIIIEDFMFGGMENITLSHYTDRTIHDQYSVPDYSSDGLVAHELAHQWYGNMITTRNWANIWLNEGFATYFSRKYREKNLGYDEGEYIRLREIRSYMAQDKRKRQPMVYHYFHEPIDLFNSHVYSKGSLVLNMIHDYLGEDEFWRSIKYYTKKNMFDLVETNDLKRSIETVTGQNMEWFFKQWVYEAGYPEYDVSWSFDSRNSAVILHVKQVQNLESSGIFKMLLKIQLDNEVKSVWLQEKEMKFEIPVENRPKLVVFNAGNRIPCKVSFHKGNVEWFRQLESGKHVLDRISAAEALSLKKGRSVELALLKSISNDPFWGVRKESASSFSKLKSKKYKEQLMQLVKGQDNRVKRVLFNCLGNYEGDRDVAKFLTEIIETETNYYAIADAFSALIKVDSIAAEKKVDLLLNRDSFNDVIRLSAISYFGSVISSRNYERLKQICSYGGTTWDARSAALKQLEKYIKIKPRTIDLFVEYLSDPNRSVRATAVNALGKFGNSTHVGFLDDLAEKDPVLSRYVRVAKGNIKKPNLGKNFITKQEIFELNQKLDEIRKILQ